VLYLVWAVPICLWLCYERGKQDGAAGLVNEAAWVLAGAAIMLILMYIGGGV